RVEHKPQAVHPATLSASTGQSIVAINASRPSCTGASAIGTGTSTAWAGPGASKASIVSATSASLTACTVSGAAAGLPMSATSATSAKSANPGATAEDTATCAGSADGRAAPAT